MLPCCGQRKPNTPRGALQETSWPEPAPRIANRTDLERVRLVEEAIARRAGSRYAQYSPRGAPPAPNEQPILVPSTLVPAAAATSDFDAPPLVTATPQPVPVLPQPPKMNPAQMAQNAFSSSFKAFPAGACAASAPSAVEPSPAGAADGPPPISSATSVTSMDTGALGGQSPTGAPQGPPASLGAALADPPLQSVPPTAENLANHSSNPSAAYEDEYYSYSYDYYTYEGAGGDGALPQSQGNPAKAGSLATSPAAPASAATMPHQAKDPFAGLIKAPSPQPAAMAPAAAVEHGSEYAAYYGGYYSYATYYAQYGFYDGASPQQQATVPQ